MSGEDLRSRTLGQVVADDYRAAEVFERFGVDYCCGGSRTVEAACREDGADVEEVARALNVLGKAADSDAASEPATWSLEELVRHIVDTHHVYVRSALPTLTAAAGRVVAAHGARHAELREVAEFVHALASEMREHMEAEESRVFPRLLELVALTATAPKDGDGAEGDGPGSIRDAIGELEGDHDRAGALVQVLRDITGGFRPPADACATYRSLYSKLEEFERDLHRHVHLENNILFPRALAIEESLRKSAGAA